MAITITCPSCSSTHRVKDELAGRRVRCPSCRGRIDIPSTAASDSSLTSSGADGATSPDPGGLVRLDGAGAGDAVIVQGVGASEVAADARWQVAKGNDGGTARASHEVVSALTLEHPEEDEPEAVHLERNNDASSDEIDLTPMVDVVFQLLIFFMVTASFSMQKSMEVPASKTDEPSQNAIPEEPPEEAESVTVFINSYNTFVVESGTSYDEAPSEQELLSLLRDARANASPPPEKLIVKAHIDSTHDRVIAAMDAGAEAEFSQLQLVTTTQDD